MFTSDRFRPFGDNFVETQFRRRQRMRRYEATVGRLARLIMGSGLALLASGCSLPLMNVIPNMPQAPTVPALQEHLQCLIVRALDRHLGPKVASTPGYRQSTDYIRWHNLVDYNVLDSINLTVFVTQSQGLNPSLNFITPLTSLGSPIKNVVESSDGTNTVSNATSNTNNFTLSVGFQLSGTQDRNFVLNYIVDLHRLYDATFTDTNGRISYVLGGPTHRSPHEICGGPDESAMAESHYGLNGDLAVEDTIDNGLRALDTAPFSPDTAGGAPGKGNQTTATASVSQSAGATGFSTKVDFTLQWGVNGGPNWTLLKFKGPGGGTGASGQLLSYTRQKQDTLISTFAATCKSDEIMDASDKAHMSWVPSPAGAPASSSMDAFEISADNGPFRPASEQSPADASTGAAPGAQPQSRKILITLAIPRDLSGLPFYNVTNAVGAISIETPVPSSKDTREADGSISWSVFAHSNPKGIDYSARGLLMDAQSGTGVGYVYIGFQNLTDHSKLVLDRFAISKNAIDFLTGEFRPGPATYWGSLASCGNSGPFLANGLNVIQQLPGSLGATFLQQPNR